MTMISFEIVLVLESAVRREENIAVQLLHQHMIFQILPAEIKERMDVMANERFYEAWIDGGVYDDAHANWSMAMSRLSSRNEKTCCLGMVG